MLQPIALPCLLISLLAVLPDASRADERFEALRREAEPIDSLPGFVERYVGVCKDPLERAACKENVQATRRAIDGKLYATAISERVRSILKVETRRGGGVRFLLTPFIDADGMALTHGEPRLDGQGRPAIGFVIIDAPAGVDVAVLEAALRTGRLELEILFRPAGAWKLKRRGEAGDYEGLKARFAAIRLVDGRTGTEFASKVM